MNINIYLRKASTVALGAGLAWYYQDDIKTGAIGSLRFGRASLTVTKIVYDYKCTDKLIAKAEENAEKLHLRSQVHKRSAEKLLDLCCVNGGAFIKVGQHLGALDYLLPTEYVTTLRVLHTDAPQTKLEDLLAVFKSELHRDPSEVFSEFDPEPLGAASLAQVHKARLIDGRTVAVKIQHPLVLDHAYIDMQIMEILMKLVSKTFEDFQFEWIAVEMKNNLPRELNFRLEASNSEKAAKMFSHLPWLKIPSVHWDLTTNRVLTMEYCDGGRVTDLTYLKKHNIDPHDVTRKIGTLYSEMIFVNGYVHCDPHPGNVFVRKDANDTQIVLLDHGLYALLSDNFRFTYGKLWQSILNANVDDIFTYCQELGGGELSGLFACMVTGRSWDSIAKGIDKQQLSTEEEEQNKETAANVMPQIAEVLNNVSSNMLLVFKTNDLIRGIEFSLKTHHRMNSFLTMSRCCVKAIYDAERKYCNSSWCLFKINVAERYANLRLSIYAFYLFVISLSSFS